MASQPESFEGKPNSFFTFCLDDFATKQSIPKAFEEKYRNFLLQESLQLKTIECDQRWDVKIKNTDGTFFIVDGWSDFVKDNNLLEMFFLVFRIVASSTLHVSVFDHDACLQLTPEPNPGDGGETTLRFVKRLKDHNFTGLRLEIPKEFAESTGIATENIIELEDESGRKWPISLTNRNNNGMYSMTGGWLAFLKGNNLQIGNILLFEFVPDSDSVVKVSVMEEGAGIELLHQAKWGGFLGERTVRRSLRTILRTSLRFVKELKDFNFKIGQMLLPKGFVVGTGIATSNPPIVIDLEDESERKWPVSVTHRQSGQYSITGGWPDFINGNNHLQVGTIVLFEFVPGSDNVVKVSAMEERAGRELLHQAGQGGCLL